MHAQCRNVDKNINLVNVYCLKTVLLVLTENFRCHIDTNIKNQMIPSSTIKTEYEQCAKLGTSETQAEEYKNQ